MADDSAGRAVLELTTESASFFSDLDRAEQKASNLRLAFSATGKSLDEMARGLTDAAKRSGESIQMIAGMSQAGAETATKLAQSTGDAFDRTEKSSSHVREAFHTVDGVLATMDIHIREQVKGVGNLADAYTGASESLGFLAKASLVATAAIGGWKIGRTIADFFDLDHKIGGATAKLMGWGDVAGAEAAAKADTLAIASQRAGHAVTTMGEALAVNEQWLQKHALEATEAAKAYKEWSDAMLELNSVGDGWQGTLETIDDETVQAVKYYLQAGVAQDKLATAYNLTAAQIRSVASALANETEINKKEQEAVDELIKSYDKLHVLTLDNARKIAADTSKLQQEQLKISNDAIVAEFNAQVQLNKAQGLDAAGAIAVQTSALQTLRISLDALHLQKVDGIAQTAQEKVLEDAYAKSLYDEAVATDIAAAALRKKNEELERVPELAKAATASVLSFNAIPQGATQDPRFNSAQGRIDMLNEEMRKNPGIFINQTGIFDGLVGRGRAAGGPVSAGMPYLVGEKRPELFIPGEDGAIAPHAGMSISVPITINGSVLSDEQKIARAVGAAIENRLKALGVRP